MTLCNRPDEERFDDDHGFALTAVIAMVRASLMTLI